MSPTALRIKSNSIDVFVRMFQVLSWDWSLWDDEPSHSEGPLECHSADLSQCDMTEGVSFNVDGHGVPCEVAGYVPRDPLLDGRVEDGGGILSSADWQVYF